MKQNYRAFSALIRRNCKLYFKDPMTFLVSLITPMILLLLFITFLGRNYEQTLLNLFGHLLLYRQFLLRRHDYR